MLIDRLENALAVAVLVTIALYVLVTLVADLAVAWLDPRVRTSL